MLQKAMRAQKNFDNFSSGYHRVFYLFTTYLDIADHQGLCPDKTTKFLLHNSSRFLLTRHEKKYRRMWISIY